MKELFFLIIMSALSAQAETDSKTFSKTFKMEYRTIKAKVICWQTCRHSRCEEADYDMFFDTDTFVEMETANNTGKSWSIGNLRCDEDIPITSEHLPALQKKSPQKVVELMDKQAREVNVLIFTDVRKQSREFVKELIQDLN